MAGYQVDFTDTTKDYITVDDNTPNTETSLTLIGRNYADYGEIVNENFLHLLENFSNTTSPSNPVEGQLWYDSTEGSSQLKVYDGSTWIAAGGLKKASTAPAAENSVIGDIWVDTSNQQVYLYSGSGWILIGPDYSEGAATGTRATTLLDTSNTTHNVIVHYVNDVPVAIISNDAFTLKAGLDAGFPVSTNIAKGINLSSTARYYGTVEKANSIVNSSGVDPIEHSFIVRKNKENILTQALRISNNTGLDIGETRTLGLSVSGSNTIIANKSNDGFIALRVQTGNTAIKVLSNGNVGIQKDAPTVALDVNGSIAGNNLTLTGTLTAAGDTELNGTLDVGGTVTALGNWVGQSLYPDTSAARDIGTSALSYRNVYATDFYGTFRGSLIGNITGTSTSAAKLNSTTTFTITGDVATTASVTFDGQTGGLTKTFNTTLNDTYHTGKSAYTDTMSGTEEVLIRKTASYPSLGDTQAINTFYRATTQDIAGLVPTMPVGMVTPYAGSSAPTGWLICNGALVSKTLYPNLFTVVGTLYGADTVTEFRIPDLQGRMPVGYKPSSVTTGNRILSIATETIGLVGGSESITLATSDLPDHGHSLMGDAGTQFYALTNVTGGLDSNSIGISIVGGDPATGLSVTGGIDGYTTQTDIDIAQPYLTMNYIIYAGV